MNTCGNCRFWSEYVVKGHGGCAHLKAPSGELAICSTADMTCPRHELEIEYPEWIPEWHDENSYPPIDTGRNLNHLSVNVLGFFSNGLPATIYYDSNKGVWYFLSNGEASTLTLKYWTYLPEGWE